MGWYGIMGAETRAEIDINSVRKSIIYSTIFYSITYMNFYRFDEDELKEQRQ